MLLSEKEKFFFLKAIEQNSSSRADDLFFYEGAKKKKFLTSFLSSWSKALHLVNKELASEKYFISFKNLFFLYPLVAPFTPSSFETDKLYKMTSSFTSMGPYLYFTIQSSLSCPACLKKRTKIYLNLFSENETLKQCFCKIKPAPVSFLALTKKIYLELLDSTPVPFIFLIESFLEITAGKRYSFLFSLYLSNQNLSGIIWDIKEEHTALQTTAGSPITLRHLLLKLEQLFFFSRSTCLFLLLSLFPIFNSDLPFQIPPTFNVLYFGGSNIGKTFFSRWVQEFSFEYPSIYLNGMSCSKVGLTASTIKLSSGKYLTEPGILVKTKGVLVFFDDFPELESYSFLHSFMSSGRVSSTKAGQNKEFFSACRMNCICTIERNTFENLEEKDFFSIFSFFPRTILSRFDLFLPLYLPPFEKKNLEQLFFNFASNKKKDPFFADFFYRLDMVKEIKLHFTQEILLKCMSKKKDFCKFGIEGNEIRTWNSFFKLLSSFCVLRHICKLSLNPLITVTLEDVDLFLEEYFFFRKQFPFDTKTKSAPSFWEKGPTKQTKALSPDQISLLFEVSSILDSEGPFNLEKKFKDLKKQKGLYELILLEKLDIDQKGNICSWVI